MKAVVCKTWGPPESLVIETLPDLSPGAGEVVIDVKAAEAKARRAGDHVQTLPSHKLLRGILGNDQRSPSIRANDDFYARALVQHLGDLLRDHTAHGAGDCAGDIAAIAVTDGTATEECADACPDETGHAA